MKKIIILSFAVIISIFFQECRSVDFLGSNIFRGEGGETFIFNSNLTFDYRKRMEGGYVYEFGRGTWRPNGKEILLNNTIDDPKELTLLTRISQFNDAQCQLVVNLLPRQPAVFAHLPNAWDLVVVELIKNKEVFTLKNETSVYQIKSPTDSIYFRIFPKSKVDHESSLLHDTLYSKQLIVNDITGKLISVDLNCDPALFAQVRKDYGKIIILNYKMIKWNNILLERQ